MKSRTLLLSFGIMIEIIAFVLVFVPDTFYTILALQKTAGTTLFMRFFGAVLFLEGFNFIRSRGTTDVRVIKSFYLGSVMADSGMGLLSFDAAINQTVNQMGYAFGIFFLIIAAIYLIAYIPLHRSTSV